MTNSKKAKASYEPKDYQGSKINKDEKYQTKKQADWHQIIKHEKFCDLIHRMENDDEDE